MIIRRAVLCTAAALAMLGLTALPASAATVPSAVPSHLVVAQPSSVCGYSDHALSRMSERGISPLDVQMAVALGADSAFLNDQGNWQYESGGTIVTLNDAGCVVTVFRR